MKIKLILLLFLFAFISCNRNKNTDTEEKVIQPNIIVFLVDDAGYADFGFMGSKDLETPNIDKLAKQGTIFTDAHVSATVCAPSRAGLITGKYQQRFGFEANGTGGIGLADDVVTIADVLKENGYKTIALGKWHLGAKEDDHPNKRGFDEFYGFLSGSRSYFPIENPSKIKMLQQNGKHVEFKGYMTDVLGDRAVNFIQENKDHPFFMYLSFNAVHTPMQAKKEHLEKYKDHSRKRLAAMTWSLDENIGKVISELDKTDLTENTLIFFLSDNGGTYTNQSSNGKLKGFKGNKFEGGHRVPFIVSWKGTLHENKKFNGLSSSLDIFSTSIAAAEISLNGETNLDGVDLLPYLKGEKTGDPHKELYWRKLNAAAARIGDYKLIRLKNYGSTLYNLRTDLGEMNDLSKKDSIHNKKLNHALKTWETKLMSPLWDEGIWMGVTYHIHKQLMQNKEILYKSPGAMKKYQDKNKTR